MLEDGYIEVVEKLGVVFVEDGVLCKGFRGVRCGILFY